MLYSFLASFIIAAGWSWAHTARQPHWKFVVVASGYWLATLVIFWILMYLFKKFVKRKHGYWTTFFYRQIPQLFFICSLYFIAFFSTSEILSLFLALAVSSILYWQTQRHLHHHAEEVRWKITNGSVFAVGLVLFIFFSLIQYIAYINYILDSKIGFHILVLARASLVTIFWLTGFIWAQAFFHRYDGYKSHVGLFLWIVFFIFSTIFWMGNIGVLYASGIYLSPEILGHAEGAGTVIFNRLTLISTALAIISLGLFAYLITRITRTHRRQGTARQWQYYGYATLLMTILLGSTIAPLASIPEGVVASYFYNYYFGKKTSITVAPEIFEKLDQQFGLKYKPEEFYVARRENVFTESKKLLPNQFKDYKPNIIIIFFESLSSKLTDVYTNTWRGELTPGLLAMANDKHTTIFKNYFNASTPTVTGILSQLCSFLPPTGHTEINDSGRLSRFYLRCLPNILREYGYEQSLYVTAVEKDYANKDTIYRSIGVDTIYGNQELKAFIPGNPLGWGWTDHQMFPAIPKMLAGTPEPFLFMLSTVDAHYPYTASKDMGIFRDGKSSVLNSYHSTDDAFGLFWNEFKKSDHYHDTILIAIGDHAIFPGSFHNIPEYKNKSEYKNLSFYDENAFLMYIPNSLLPKKVDVYSSGIDFAPTLLHILNINTSTTFEGHSIFDDRKNYPNLLGMHEFGLYTNQIIGATRQENYDLPAKLSTSCPNSVVSSSTMELTLCEYEKFYRWKREMLERGRLWMPK